MIATLMRITWLRYVGASAIALGIDMGLFLALLQLGAPPLGAAGSGYAAGIVAHWLISSRAVFTDSVADTQGGRQRQQALFVLSALVGLGLTMAIVGTGDRLGLDPRLAKIAAIAVAFQTTYWLRRRIVFA